MILKVGDPLRGGEAPGSRGKAVQIGDLIMIQSGSIGSTGSSALHQSDYVLGIHDGAGGQQPRLLNKDRTGLGLEIWQIEHFGSQPLPSWLNRPYLRLRAVLNYISIYLFFFLFSVETFCGQSEF